MVLILSVLILNLLSDLISNYVIHAQLGIDPFRFTLIGMLALVFLLLPAFKILNAKIELLTARMLASGSNSFGKFLGLLLSFTLLFGLLFLIYLYHWFGISVFQQFR